MNAINSFIISFCSGCILLGFLYMLCPTGNMSNPVKYVFCLCFVCCVTGAAIGIDPPDFSRFENTSNTQILTEQNVAVTTQMTFGEALAQKNINFRKITVDTNKLDDGSIVINRVIIYTNESEQKIAETIGSDSYEVVVVNE